MERRLDFLCGSLGVVRLWLLLSPQSKLHFMMEQHYSDRGEMSFDLSTWEQGVWEGVVEP